MRLTRHPVRGVDAPPEPAGTEHLGPLKRVARGTAVTWTMWVLGRVLTLATLLLLTHALSPKDLGYVFSALATGLLGATVSMGGLPDATTRHAAAASGSSFGRGDVRRALIRFLAVLPGIAGLLVLISSASSQSLDLNLVLASFLLAVTQGATTIVASIFRARGQAGRFSFVTTVFTSAGRAAVAAAALVVGVSVSVILWSFVLLNVALIAFTWRPALRDLPRTSSRFEGDREMQLGGVVWSLMGNLDLVTVGVLLGNKIAGEYGAALRMSEISIQFLIALSTIYLPEATRLAVAHRSAALRSLYTTTTRWSTLFTVTAAGVGIVAAPSLARLLFPHDPGGETALLRILFAGYAIHGALGQTYSTLLALGAYPQIWRSSIVSLPLMILGTAFLTQTFGAVGAACSTCVAYTITGIWWAWQVAGKMGSSPFDEFYGRALLACLAGVAVASVVAVFGAPIAPLGSIVAIALAAVAVTATLVLQYGGLSPNERASVVRFGARLGRRTG